MSKTYWNYEPCGARKVRVIVGNPADAPPLAWYRGLEGTERDAVEVTYYGTTFYLDDDAMPDGWEDDRETALQTLPADEQEQMRSLLALIGEQPKPKAGDGWRKVTLGQGGPDWAHRSLPVERVLHSEYPA